MRQISNRRVQATWTPPANFSGATYRVYINTMNVNTGGTEVTGTSYTIGTLKNGSTVTVHVRATTGTYLSIPTVSEALTVRGKDITYLHFTRCVTLYALELKQMVSIIWIFIQIGRYSNTIQISQISVFNSQSLHLVHLLNKREGSA